MSLHLNLGMGLFFSAIAASSNYRHYHKSLRLPVGDRKPLRFKKQWNHRTPAMAMGVTQEALTWRLLFLAPIQVTH